jgi:hypothetical protein
MKKIQLSTPKEKVIPASITLTEHSNLTPDERKAAYKFFEHHIVELFDNKDRKKAYKMVNVKIKKSKKSKKK